jgi:hypothetical protein
MKHLAMAEVFVPKQIAKQRPFVRRNPREEDSSILSFESLD